MSAVDTGGQAFPLATGWVERDPNEIRTEKVVLVRERDPGMTLRDYIAIHADKGDIGIPDSIADCAALLGIQFIEYRGLTDYPKVVIKCRYAYADAWIKERNQ